LNDYDSEQTAEGPASIAGGLDTIVDGIEDVTASAYDAVENGLYVVGDSAETMYHSAAAAGDAFVGDMSGAGYHNEAANEEARQIHEDIDNIGQDIGF
jgi:hypothetical protein